MEQIGLSAMWFQVGQLKQEKENKYVLFGAQNDRQVSDRLAAPEHTQGRDGYLRRRAGAPFFLLTVRKTN